MSNRIKDELKEEILKEIEGKLEEFQNKNTISSKSPLSNADRSICTLEAPLHMDFCIISYAFFFFISSKE